MNRRSARPLARKIRHRHADRTLLLEAAEHIFSERGYYETSIRDIARGAGFSVGGVYQFFPSKDELYLAVIDAQWAEFFKAIEPALTSKGFTRQIAELTERWLAYFDARRAFFRIYLADRNRFAGTLRDRVSRTVTRNQRRLRLRVERLMIAGIRQRRVRFTDARLLTSAFIGMLHDSILDALSPEGGAMPQAEAFVAMFLHGAERRP